VAVVTDALTVWVIYFSPLDYPGKYVLRGQDVLRGQSAPVPHEHCTVRDSLDECRAAVCHLYRLERHPGDPPVIVETWI
jgi:hypothetical protein